MGHTKPAIICALEGKLWNAIGHMADQGITAVQCVEDFARQASQLDLYQESARNYFCDFWTKSFTSPSEVVVGAAQLVTPRARGNVVVQNTSHPGPNEAAN